MSVRDIFLTPADIWVAPIGTAFPAASVAAGASWGTGWTKLGMTKKPLKLMYTFTVKEIEVEQYLSPVKRRKTREALKFETELAEFKLENTKYAFDGTYTLTTAPGVSTNGLEEITVGGNLCVAEHQWGFEGVSESDDCGDKFPIRIFVYRATADGGGELEFSKIDSLGIPLKIDALADTSKDVGKQLYKVQKVLPPTG